MGKAVTVVVKTKKKYGVDEVRINTNQNEYNKHESAILSFLSDFDEVKKYYKLQIDLLDLARMLKERLSELP